MDVLRALILGIAQGLTEFLPVSSSGHLVLLQKIFGMSEPALLFDTILHAGTLLAVLVVLRRDIISLLRRPFQRLTGLLIAATVPAVAAALLFNGIIERAFESGRFLGVSFLITAVFLAAAELFSRRAGAARKDSRGMGFLDALVVGVLQAAAIIPGVSRSGATISGALARGLDRDFAARFSFLLSVPAILGAIVFQFRDIAKGAALGVHAEGARAASVGTAALIAGAVSAALVGFFAMKFMLKIVREKSLFGFALYTAFLGALILIDQFGTHLVF